MSDLEVFLESVGKDVVRDLQRYWNASPADAEDAFQEAVKCKIDQLFCDPAIRTRPYMMTVAIRKYFDDLRLRQNLIKDRRRAESDPGITELSDTKTALPRELSDRQERVQHARKRLDSESNWLITLLYDYGLTQSYVAKLLGISQTTVCRRHRKALRDLHRELRPSAQDEQLDELGGAA
jgi:RNA polymerase sigma factor (sigma-70 family)